MVVLPLVPVTPRKRFGSARQASSTSPTTSISRSRAAAITGASRGTPGLLTTVRVPSSCATPSVSRKTSTPTPSNPAVPSGCPESTARTTSPRAASIRATACPERASPTMRKGPCGRGGRIRLAGTLKDTCRSFASVPDTPLQLPRGFQVALLLPCVACPRSRRKSSATRLVKSSAAQRPERSSRSASQDGQLLAWCLWPIPASGSRPRASKIFGSFRLTKTWQAISRSSRSSCGIRGQSWNEGHPRHFRPHRATSPPA